VHQSVCRQPGLFDAPDKPGVLCLYHALFNFATFILLSQFFCTMGA